MALTKITSNAFAASAVDSDAVGANTITTAKIADNNVTHAKLHTTMDLSSKTVTLPSLSQNLTIEKSANPTFSVIETGAGAVTVQGTGSGGRVYSNTGNKLLLGANGQNSHLNIDTAGNVGIGTTAPSETLEVNGAIKIDTGAGHLRFNHDTLNGAIFNDTGNLLFYAQGDQQIILHANGTQQLLIDDTRAEFKGNVGIGIASPSTKLHVYGTSGNQYIRAEATANSTRSALITLGKQSNGTIVQGFFGSVGDANQVEVATISNHTIKFYTNNSPTGDNLIYGSNPRLWLTTPTGINGLRVYGDTTPFEFQINSGSYSGAKFTMGSSGDISLIAVNTSGSDTYNDSPNFFLNGTRWNGSANVTSFQGAIRAHVRSANSNDGYLGIGANANADALVIDASTGDVGIGKTNPDVRLHIVDAVSNTISPATAVAKFEGTGNDGLAFGNIQSAPYSSWIQAGYLSNTYSPAWNNGYPIALNPSGGNVGIGTTNPSEELHVYDAGNDPYVLVDGSGGNRDSGYKINAGNGVKIAVRADAGGGMYFADNAISVTGSIGNSQYRTVIVDSEIQVGGRPGVTNSNPARAIVARMIEAQELNSGYAMLSGQGDTLTGYARRKNSGTGTNTFFFGPYGTFPAGQFTALFRLKITVVSSGGLGYIDVVGSGTTDPTGNNPRPRTLNLSTSSFSVDGQYQYFALDFDRTTNGGGIEFRWINATNNADCYVDHILVLPRLNH